MTIASEVVVDPVTPCIKRQSLLNVFIHGVLGVGVPLSVSSGSTLQLPLPLHVVEMSDGPSLAPNPTNMALNWQATSTDRLVDALLLAYRVWFRGERFYEQKYREAFMAILANLDHAYRHSRQLLVSRSTGHRRDPVRNPGRISTRVLNPMYDFLAELGLVTLVKGRQNDYDHATSFLVADPLLIGLLHKERVRIKLHDGTPLVLVRDNDKKPLNVNLPKDMEGVVRQHNELWLRNDATLEGAHLMPCLLRIFNGSLQYGGRYYGSYQNLPKKDREKIRINGQITVELDFESIHVRILYAWEGLPFVGDPYCIEGYDRDTVKRAVLTLLNSENLRAFEANITRSGNIEVQRKYREYTDKRARYDYSKAIGLHGTEPKKPKCLDGFIEGITPGTKGHELLEAIRAKHPQIAHYFGADRIGLRLQNADSRIMTEVLKQLRSTPVLLVHDSVRCRRDDAAKVQSVMEAAARKVTEFAIPIKLS